MVSKNQTYELESLLFDVSEKGFIHINKYKLWRLLGKGSNAAGTWKSLLDAWEELGDGFKRVDLLILELPSGDFIITKSKTYQVTEWADETGSN